MSWTSVEPRRSPGAGWKGLVRPRRAWWWPQTLGGAKGLRKRAFRRALLSPRVLLWLAVLATGLALLGEQGWIRAKAVVASILIDRAFASYLEDGQPHPPWPWADTYPIARLRVPRLHLDRVVLAGAAGESMAFGPGHLSGTAAPNASGRCVIAGHRDSWFRFLEDLRPGDVLELTSRSEAPLSRSEAPFSSSETRRYRVTDLAVVPHFDTAAIRPDGHDRLTLLTCYPFGGLLRSPWRYLVSCRPEAAPGDRNAPLADGSARVAVEADPQSQVIP